jgi:hypothetical protein
MVNGLEILMSNDKEKELPLSTRIVKRFDSFVDSGLGIAATVAFGIPVAYFGYEYVGPAVEYVLDNVSQMLENGPQNVTTALDMTYLKPVSSVVSTLGYFGVVDRVIRKSKNRTEGNVTENLNDSDLGFFSKAFYVPQIKSGMKKALGYFSRKNESA